MVYYIKDQDLLDLLDENGRSILTAAKINRLERICFPTELHVGDRAWKKAMSILDKKYAEAKKAAVHPCPAGMGTVSHLEGVR